MSRLYNRVAQLNVNGREFNYPPFSIEFEQNVAVGSLSSATVKLYNPAPDTIKAAEGIKEGRSFTYPYLTVDAGYSDNFGTCIIGEISDYKVSQSGADKILEMKVSDKTKDWANALINKTWKNTRANVIIRSMLATIDIDIGDINLGDNKLYTNLSVMYLRDGLKKIMKDTLSEYNFNSGVIEINPKTPTLKKVIQLTYTSGLIGKPEKTQSGLKFKTLFMYQLNSGSIVNIVTNTINKNFKIKKGVKKFSTFGDSYCEWEAVEI